MVHPRLATKAKQFGINLEVGKIRPFGAISYPQLIRALFEASGVVTDSGGLQKEAFLMRRPCITLRTETEWVETVDLGWNVLVPTCDQQVHEILAGKFLATDAVPFGDGHAATRVVELLAQHL